MKTTKTIKPMLTPWGEKVDTECPLAEYPRPQLERTHWQCLNGKWQYAICDDSTMPSRWDGDILVPFSPECLLSGVSRELGETQTLWYKRSVLLDMPEAGERLLLHFGAVDQHCTVYCNGNRLGSYSGGYWPFSFDITTVIQSGNNEIALSVQDFSDGGNEAYGKQKRKRGEIWYTRQSGIWQTVWCERVPAQYVESIKITPQYQQGAVDVSLVTAGQSPLAGEVRVLDEGQVVATGTLQNNAVRLQIPHFKSWTPETPFLYILQIDAGEDRIKSYFGMRAFAVGKGKRGDPCLLLNGEPIFHNGLLDQGYWSDGMYTAPSDEAMIWEINKVKALGFNMLRKHIKIEPLRWYYHCDRLGMLVWQDFVNGGAPYKPFVIQYLPWVGIQLNDHNYQAFGRTDPAGREIFVRDMVRTTAHLYNTVSLSVWVPFNEGWGQFDAKEIAAQLRSLDDTRPIDHASGYHDQGVGDFHSYHIYYKRFRPGKDKHERVLALTEFGGYSLPTEGHMASDALFGYKIFRSQPELEKAIVTLYEQDVLRYISQGLSAVVYTQVSDVEDEINGLFTYDRKVVKIDEQKMQDMNKRLYEAFNKTVKDC